MSHVVILIGYSGAGKTTYARKLMAHEPHALWGPNALRHVWAKSVEEGRPIQELTPLTGSEAEPSAHEYDRVWEGYAKSEAMSEWANRYLGHLLAKATEGGPPVIIDKMNLSYRTRHSLIRRARKMGLGVHGVFFDTPLDVAMSRSLRALPSDVWQTHSALLEQPVLTHHYDQFITV